MLNGKKYNMKVSVMHTKQPNYSNIVNSHKRATCDWHQSSQLHVNKRRQLIAMRTQIIQIMSFDNFEYNSNFIVDVLRVGMMKM